MAYTTTVANAILTASHPTSGTATLGSLTITYPIRVRLMTANGSAGSAGTALADGGSYVNTTGLSIGANWAAAASGSQSTNAAVSQTNMPAATVTGVELWDSSGTPQRIEWGDMVDRTTTSGDTLTFASGAITSAIS